MLGIGDGLGDGIWLGAGVKADIFVNSSPPAGFVASFRPSRGGLRFAIWRQVEQMTTKTYNSSSSLVDVPMCRLPQDLGLAGSGRTAVVLVCVCSHAFVFAHGVRTWYDV
jgi:hypothetical protein